MLCVAVCCIDLQCVAVCCSVLRCSVLQCVAVCCSVLQRVAKCCSVLCVAASGSTFQCVAACWNVLQHSADDTSNQTSAQRDRDEIRIRVRDWHFKRLGPFRHVEIICDLGRDLRQYLSHVHFCMLGVCERERRRECVWTHAYIGVTKLNKAEIACALSFNTFVSSRWHT